jgi:hypothetical protein
MQLFFQRLPVHGRARRVDQTATGEPHLEPTVKAGIWFGEVPVGSEGVLFLSRGNKTRRSIDRGEKADDRDFL